MTQETGEDKDGKGYNRLTSKKCKVAHAAEPGAPDSPQNFPAEMPSSARLL